MAQQLMGVFLLVFITLSRVAFQPVLGLHISGRMPSSRSVPQSATWRTHSEFIGKFGVQKDDESSMFVYGSAKNHAAASSDGPQMLLVVAPVGKWKEFVKVVSSKNGGTCNSSLLTPFLSSPSSVSTCASKSNPYYRLVPCHNETCLDSDQGKLPEAATFVYKLEPDKTEFYYMFFVYCIKQWTANDSCSWISSSDDVSFTYSISVTTDPFAYHNLFTFQFPANLEGIFISYFTFSLLYVLLIPIHLFLTYQRRTQKQYRLHVLVLLFTVALVMESANVFIGFVHYSVYCNNGQGVVPLYYIKDFCNLVGNWFLVLVFILLAGGWQVTTVKSIKWKYGWAPIWTVYIILSLVYCIWKVIFLEEYPWELNDPLQTWAGGLYLTIRGLVLFYVWYQLYHIYQQEESLPKLRLYKVLFVLFTIWFWYLPLLVFIVTFTGHVTASLVIENISTALNFLANLIMVVLFCPKLSHHYFQFDDAFATSTKTWALKTFYNAM